MFATDYVTAREGAERALAPIDNAEFDDAQQLLTVWCRSQGIDPEWARVFLSAAKNPQRKTVAIEWIRRLENTHRDIGPTTYARIGAFDEAFASARSAVANNAALFFVDVSNRQLGGFRRDPRFAEPVGSTGLFNYWNRYGWNGYCQVDGRELRCD